MDTTVITDAESLYSTFEKLISWSATVDVCVAWATSSNGQGRHWQALDLNKVRRAVVGTAFAQTEPDALMALNQKADCLRLMIDTPGTFHPKVILGRKGKFRHAIVGSANLTTAAFTQNTELSVSLEGDSSNRVFKQIERFINDQWEEGEQLDDDWLARYTLAWKEAKRRKIHVPWSPLAATSLADLDMSWDQYVALISGQEGRWTTEGFKISIDGPAPSYMVELRHAREAFRRTPHFASMGKDELNLMMGFGKLSGGLLGNMQAARYAKEVVRKNPGVIGGILDRLPLDGPISPSLAADLLGKLTEIKGVKLGVATRFFALKRPDLFVSVNNASKDKLVELQGGQEVKTVTQYINLLNTLWATEWHRTARPRDKAEAALWDCRVALLDAAIYGVE